MRTVRHTAVQSCHLHRLVCFGYIKYPRRIGLSFFVRNTLSKDICCITPFQPGSIGLSPPMFTHAARTNKTSYGRCINSAIGGLFYLLSVFYGLVQNDSPDFLLYSVLSNYLLSTRLSKITIPLSLALTASSVRERKPVFSSIVCM